MKNKKTLLLNFIKSCRIRIILTLVGLIFIFLYRILLLIPDGANNVYKKIIKPLHRVMASACDHVNASVAEIVIIVAAVVLIIYTIVILVNIIKNRHIVSSVILNISKLLLSYIMCFCVIYGLFCVLWGVYYSAKEMGVKSLCGISSQGNSHEDLIAVDYYFVELANEYSNYVNRDQNGHYLYDKEKVFDHSKDLYDEVCKEYPLLIDKPHRAKEFKFSIILSYMDFTGFFFPFTAEANINTDSPDCMTPSVIAHELAHQRGIAREDEANFMAVLASLEDGDIDYVYSASLMALIHLQNALYKSGDVEKVKEIMSIYSDGVKTDLADNNKYWEPFRKTVTYKATNTTYEAFLKSYDQDMGLETYGACVDLLVDYYKKIEKNN